MEGEGVDTPKVDLDAANDLEHDVLQTLTRIPRGEVRTYAWVARQVGRPRAVRAVANVIARNAVPYVVPCHRVVPSSGGIGNYIFGSATKRALLEREGVDVDRARRAGEGARPLHRLEARRTSSASRPAAMRSGFRRRTACRSAMPTTRSKADTAHAVTASRWRHERGRCVPSCRPRYRRVHAHLDCRRRRFTGDFWFTHAAGDRLWFALGDVAGKGLPAAIVMAMIQEELEHRITSCARAGCDPATTMKRLDEFLKPLLPSNRFATAVIGWLDDDGSITLVNAGHCPPMIVRARRQHRGDRLDRTGRRNRPELALALDDARRWIPAICSSSTATA